MLTRNPQCVGVVVQKPISFKIVNQVRSPTQEKAKVTFGNRLAVLLSRSGQNSIQNGVPSSSQILYNMEGLRQEPGVVQVLHDHAYRGNVALVLKTYKLAGWILLFLYFVVLVKRDTGSHSRCMSWTWRPERLSRFWSMPC